MKLHDSRRLTGPNLVWDRHGAVIDVELAPGQADAFVAAWTERARAMLDAVGWDSEETAVHRFSYGASLALSAPIDALYAATEIAEWAFRAAAAGMGGPAAEGLATAAPRLRAEIDAEANPAWAALERAAAEHGVTMLSDDDAVSLGLGCRSRTFAIDELPLPKALDWRAFGRIPVGLVTGTNGKTTSVRLSAAIARAAGLTPGLSSTDWVAAGDEVVERGDYAGPGGARTVLRDRRVQIALLETARGGLLRRGLGVAHADAALITNVSEDHLGDFGSRTVDELLEVKWVVSRAVRGRGTLVLNADDARLRRRARRYHGRTAWFSPDPGNAMLREHVARAGHAAGVVDGVGGLWRAGKWHPLLEVAAIPIALGGSARHNVSNALGAAAFMAALGMPDGAIATGLRALTDEDNPGRCNLFEIDGVHVLVDFAHNLDGMRAVFDMARAIDARRRALVFSQAGDRPDEDIRALGRSAWALGLQRAFTVELAQYARGRERGEVAALLHAGLAQAGATAGGIEHLETEPEALDAALAWARPGDLVIFLALGEQATILASLRERAGATSG